MPFVLDASIAACWAFDDEDIPSPPAYRLRHDPLRLPTIPGCDFESILRRAHVVSLSRVKW